MYPETALEQAIRLAKLQPGDYVWAIRHGWIKVFSITPDRTFIVKADGGQTYTYFNDGRYFENDKFPTVFLEPLLQLDQTPKPIVFKPGDKVMVRSNIRPWRRRYFAYRDPDFPGIFCYIGGTTHWSSNSKTAYWEVYRLPTEDEL